MKCSNDLKIFANSWSSASNFKTFSQSLEQFFLTVGQNNFGNKIPLKNFLLTECVCNLENGKLSVNSFLSYGL